MQREYAKEVPEARVSLFNDISISCIYIQFNAINIQNFLTKCAIAFRIVNTELANPTLGRPAGKIEPVDTGEPYIKTNIHVPLLILYSDYSEPREQRKRSKLQILYILHEKSTEQPCIQASQKYPCSPSQKPADLPWSRDFKGSRRGFIANSTSHNSSPGPDD
jgi:hypothetical protein